MKLSKMSVVGAVVAGLIATTVGVASPAAAATTPPWEPDPQGNGTIAFFDATGAAITGGSDLSHLFAYAEASSAEDPAGFHKASIAFAFPNHALPTSSWFVQNASAATTYPNVSAPAPVNTFTNPVAAPGPADANLTAALGAGVLDTTPGYANVMQIRLAQSGGTGYWTADISYDTTAGTWTQIYPNVVTGAPTTTTLAASPASPQPANSTVGLTATVTPAGAAGTVQFKDAGVNVGTPVAVAPDGTATTTTGALAAGTHSFTASFIPTDAAAFTGSSSSATDYVITPVADSSALAAAKSVTIGYGKATTVSAKLTDTKTGAVIPGVSVQLLARTSTAKPFTLAKTLTTNASGVAALSVKPTVNTQYQWVFAGNATHAAATSGVESVAVAQVVSLRATATRLRHGTTTKLYGVVSPNEAGQYVYLQQLVGRTWKTVLKARLVRQKLPNGTTTVGYVFALTPRSAGRYTYRVSRPATSANAAGLSVALLLTVS